MAAFPTLASGVVTQYPYDEVDQWVISEATLANGLSTTRAEHSVVLKKFVLRFDLVQYDDTQVLELFFDSMAGKTGEFTFTDDSGHVWNKVRFDQDYIEIRYNEINSYSTEIHLSAEPN